MSKGPMDCPGEGRRGPRIIVDADACPRNVLQMCSSVGREMEVSLVTVASFNHDIQSDDHIVVDDSPEAADIKIMNMMRSRDIIVSQDWGLAAMALARGAACVSPRGHEYDEDQMDGMLEIREALAKHRRSGGKTGGPKKRVQRDDGRFEATLRRLVKEAKGEGHGESRT